VKMNETKTRTGYLAYLGEINVQENAYLKALGEAKTYTGSRDQSTLTGPERVMDPEAQYLAALESAATYQIEGTVLELRTQDGALAVDFSKK
jgi:heat shock protein HslJ